MWSNILKWLGENILAIVFDCQEEIFFLYIHIFFGGTMIWTEPTAKGFA